MSIRIEIRGPSHAVSCLERNRLCVFPGPPNIPQSPFGRKYYLLEWWKITYSGPVWGELIHESIHVLMMETKWETGNQIRQRMIKKKILWKNVPQDRFFYQIIMGTGSNILKSCHGCLHGSFVQIRMWYLWKRVYSRVRDSILGVSSTSKDSERSRLRSRL